MPPNATAAELQRLAEHLYGNPSLPGAAGDIPAIKADVKEIRSQVAGLTGEMQQLTGFYRGVRNITLIGASVMTIITSLLAVYAFVVK